MFLFNQLSTKLFQIKGLCNAITRVKHNRWQIYLFAIFFIKTEIYYHFPVNLNNSSWNHNSQEERITCACSSDQAQDKIWHLAVFYQINASNWGKIMITEQDIMWYVAGGLSSIFTNIWYFSNIKFGFWIIIIYKWAWNSVVNEFWLNIRKLLNIHFRYFLDGSCQTNRWILIKTNN